MKKASKKRAVKKKVTKRKLSKEKELDELDKKLFKYIWGNKSEEQVLKEQVKSYAMNGLAGY